MNATIPQLCYTFLGKGGLLHRQRALRLRKLRGARAVFSDKGSGACKLSSLPFACLLQTMQSAVRLTGLSTAVLWGLLFIKVHIICCVAFLPRGEFRQFFRKRSGPAAPSGTAGPDFLISYSGFTCSSCSQ